MVQRRAPWFVLVGAFLSLGAQYRTPNFLVEAPTQQIAQQVGQYAEHYRKEKALQWIGQEMPPWPEPCPVKVTVTMNGSGGATSFAFDRGRVLGQSMNIEGSLDRLLASVLPHEVTHTVFAYYFRCPVPRWADEGGSVLSEDEVERNRHDAMVRQILNTPGRAMPLRRLFALREYPNDVMALYAQGYSVSNFLVGSSGRPAFLAFVASGMREGWDNALRAHYRYNSVEELEQAWLTHLKNTKKQPVQLAQNRGPADTQATGRIVVRLTAPPAQPLDETPRPVYRGQSPDAEAEVARPISPVRQEYLPDYNRAAPDRPVQWGPPQNNPTADAPPRVRLGTPEYITTPFQRREAQQQVSPAGYPK